MSRLGPTVPARSGVQNRGKAEQGESSAKLSLALPAPLGMCLQRGLGRQPKGSLLPGRRQRASGGKLTHKDTRGRVWRALPNQSTQLLRGCEEGRVGYLWAAECLAQGRNVGTGGTLGFQPPSPVTPGPSSCKGMSVGAVQITARAARPAGGTAYPPGLHGTRGGL